MVDLGPCWTSTPSMWEGAIREAADGRLVIYTDGSRNQESRVGGGWYADGNGAGSEAVHTVVTV